MWGGNVFSRICLSVCSWGGFPMWPLFVMPLVSHIGLLGMAKCVHFGLPGSVPVPILKCPYPDLFKLVHYLAYTSIGKWVNLLRLKGLFVAYMCTLNWPEVQINPHMDRQQQQLRQLRCSLAVERRVESGNCPCLTACLLSVRPS